MRTHLRNILMQQLAWKWYICGGFIIIISICIWLTTAAIFDRISSGTIPTHIWNFGVLTWMIFLLTLQFRLRFARMVSLLISLHRWPSWLLFYRKISLIFWQLWLLGFFLLSLMIAFRFAFFLLKWVMLGIFNIK